MSLHNIIIPPPPHQLPTLSPTTSNWKSRVSRTSGKTYYYNEKTGESALSIPHSDNTQIQRFQQKVSKTTGSTYFINIGTNEACLNLPHGAVVVSANATLPPPSPSAISN